MSEILDASTGSLAKLEIKFDGDNDIDAKLLANTLDNVSEIFRTTAGTVYPEANTSMRISAINPGSFIIFLQASVSNYQYISDALFLAIDICGIIISVIALKKNLKGVPPKIVNRNGDNITVVGDGNTITVKKTILKVYQNSEVNARVSNIFRDLSIDGTRKGLSFQTNNDSISINPSEFSVLSSPDFIDNTDVKQERNESMTSLLIRQPDLMGRSKWVFYDGHKIEATIEDTDFLERVHRGEFSVKAGDKLPVIMRTEYLLDISGNPIWKSERYYISKITGPIIGRQNFIERQIDIFDKL